MKVIQKDNGTKNIVKVRGKEYEVPEDKTGYKLPLFERMILSPRSDAELDVIAHDLLFWAEKDTSIVFDEFVAISGMATSRLYVCAERHEKLKAAIGMAKQLIGSRREKGAVEGKYSATVVMGMMPLYNQEYRDWKKEQTKSLENLAGGERFVIVEKMPSSPLVPEKKKDEE